MRTFDVEDATAQRSGDVGQGRFFRHVKKVIFRGHAGDGFDFFDEVFGVDVVSGVVTQHLGRNGSK